MSTRQVDDAVVVAVAGAVDMASAPQLGNVLAAVLAGSPVVLVIDLSAVDFLGSMGLNVLLRARRDIGSGGLRVVATGAARRSIEVAGLDGALQL